MENPLNEAHEEIKHLEHAPESRLKIVITVTILTVTMLTTLAGAMAAIWSAKHAEAQRERQQATAATLQASLQATTQQATIDQSLDDLSEAAYRSAFLNVYSLEVDDSAMAADLRTQANQAINAQEAIQSTLPAGAGDAGYDAKLRQSALVNEQVAKAHAQQSVGWLAKSNGALAVVSMLALALFLLGLALTIGNRPTQIGFTALAIVMTLIAGGRFIQISTSDIVVASESCIDRYGEAVTKANSGGTREEAITELDAVVHDCAHFDAAWTALGQLHFDSTDIKALNLAQESFQQALDVADARSADLYNNLGYMEVLTKDFTDARQNLDKALALSPENPVVLTSRAELAAAQGDDATADKFLDDALEVVADHGPYFRDQFYFANLRSDQRAFSDAGFTSDSLTKFFLKGREAEASIGALGTIEPGDTHGARITGLILRKSDTKLGQIADFVTIGFTYHDLQVGDHISVRFYANDLTYDLTASIPNTVVTSDSTLVGSGIEQPDSHFRLGLTNKGATTMEVYLNGVSQGEVSITI